MISSCCFDLHSYIQTRKDFPNTSMSNGATDATCDHSFRRRQCPSSCCPFCRLHILPLLFCDLGMRSVGRWTLRTCITRLSMIRAVSTCCAYSSCGRCGHVLQLLILLKEYIPLRRIKIIAVVVEETHEACIVATRRTVAVIDS